MINKLKRIHPGSSKSLNSNGILSTGPWVTKPLNLVTKEHFWWPKWRHNTEKKQYRKSRLSHFSYKKTKWLVTTTLVPHTPAVPPTGLPGDVVISLPQQNTGRLDEQIPMT